MALAAKSGLGDPADAELRLPRYFGANAGLKVTAMVAGMPAGADSLNNMALLRRGGMKKLFVGTHAPSTLGSFLRAFTFGHVRQLDGDGNRLIGVATHTPIVTGIDNYALVDIDDTRKKVHGYQMQGSGYVCSAVRGVNALIGVVSTPEPAPIIIGSRLRKGSTGSPRGAGKFLGDTLVTVRRLRRQMANSVVLLRADSAVYCHAVVAAANRAGAKVSITARMDPTVKRTIGTIRDDQWTTINCTNAIGYKITDIWISSAEVVVSALSSRKKSERIEGRLVERRTRKKTGKTPEDNRPSSTRTASRVLQRQGPGHCRR